MNRQEAFKSLFDEHYKSLVKIAYFRLNDVALAEDVTQEVFMKIWNRPSLINMNNNPGAFLRTMVKNKSMDTLKAATRRRLREESVQQSFNVTFNEKVDLSDDVKKKVQTAIASLPERCRSVFLLAKLEGCSYKEIAEEMSISVKTVENQMSKALKFLRNSLGNFLLLTLLLKFKTIFN